MPDRRSRDVHRSGFTLIELVIVIVMIAILMSLLLAAVMRVLLRIPEVQTRTEISEMDSALGAFMADFNLSDPPPSTLTLYPNISSYPAGDPSLAFLTKMFGKNLGYPAGTTIHWDGGMGSGPWTLTGEQCLVFYLSGIGNQGFSYNNINPTPVSGQRTRGPYFTFQTSRLVTPSAVGMTSVPNQFLVYVDAWKGKTLNRNINPNGNPYAYFSTNGINNAYKATDCTSGATPYIIGTNQYINPLKYQIISAGHDGVFGNGNMGMGLAPGAGADDQGNRT